MGSVFLTGVAINHEGDTLKNTPIKIYLKNKKELIKTDSLGCYKLEVEWMSPCPNGGSPEQREEESKRINPAYIIFKYKDTKIKVKNEWQKYGGAINKTKVENIIF